MSLSNTEGSGISWRKNSGEISEPPVSSRPSIFSWATLRFRAFQTLSPGYFAKTVRNHFASFGRIHVARFGIGEFATWRWPCKEHLQRAVRAVEHVRTRISQTGRQTKGHS